MFQQSTTVAIDVRDPQRVVVRDGDGRAALGDGESSGDLRVTRTSSERSRRANTDAPSHVRLARDADGAIVVDWEGVHDLLVASTGAVHAGNDLELGLPGLSATDLTVPVASAAEGAPCVHHSGRGGSYWRCRRAEWSGTLATPWSNVASIKRHVVPIGHEWATLDLVGGAILTTLAVTFLVPPHDRRGATDDVTAGAVLGVPGILGLVNGIGILLRSPYDETWVGTPDGKVRRAD
jgi:hypothetical protein